MPECSFALARKKPRGGLPAPAEALYNLRGGPQGRLRAKRRASLDTHVAFHESRHGPIVVPVHSQFSVIGRQQPRSRRKIQRVSVEFAQPWSKKPYWFLK